MKRKPALLLALSLYSVSPGVTALGLGDIELLSSLNQPLQAHIALQSWQPGDLEGIKVNLASQAYFERAGLERFAVLAELVFEVVEAPNGSAYVNVSSKLPIKEPFLDFLVEVSWSKGRVFREYTLLIDPPLYGKAVAQAIGRPVVTGFTGEETRAAVGKTGRNRRAQEVPKGSAIGDRTPVKAGEEEAQGSSSPTVTSERHILANPSNRTVTYGPTASGDTLWEVANRLATNPSTNINQMMLALFRKNPHAFLQQNMNLLKRGIVLHIPDPETIALTSDREALAEVKRHHALWEEYRQALVVQTGDAPVAVLPTLSRTEGIKGGREQEPERSLNGDRVRLLSAGTATSGESETSEAQDNTRGLRHQLAMALEDAEAKQRENQDLRDRVTEAEALIKDLQRLVALKDDTIASLQHQYAQRDKVAGKTSESVEALGPEMSKANVAGPLALRDDSTSRLAESMATAINKSVSSEGAEQGSAAIPKNDSVALSDNSEVKLPVPAAASQALGTDGVKIKPDASVPENDQAQQAVLAYPMLIGAGLLGSLFLFGSGYAIWRRRRKGDGAATVDSASPASVSTETEKIALEGMRTERPTQVESDRDVPATLDRAEDLFSASPLVEEQSLDEDPLAEVNVYLAYERFDQAERLVKEAVERYPDRQEYKLKLLEVLAAAGNTTGFGLYAQTLRDAVGEHSPLMDRALAWWRELSPDQDLFAVPATEHENLHGITDEAGWNSSSEVEMGDGAEAAVGSDTVHLKSDDGVSAADVKSREELDFNLGTESIEASVGASSTEGTVDFDLGLTMESASEGPEEADGLDFSLDELSADGVSSQNRHNFVEDLDVALHSEVFSLSESGGEETLDFDLGHLESTEASSLLSPGADTRTLLSEEISNVALQVNPSSGDLSAQVADLVRDVTNAGEGTIDFDLGFEAESQTVASEAPAALEMVTAVSQPSRSSADVQLVGAQSSSNQGLVSDAIDLNVLAMEQGSSHGDKVTEPNGVRSHMGARGNVESGIGLELELVGVTEDDVVRQTVVDHNVDEPAAGPEETKTRAYDGAQDKWAEADSNGEDEADRTLVLGKGLSEDLDEIQTKLELAQAYMDMGDAEGARGILDEVMTEGDDHYKQMARNLLQKLA